jgi:hypothetical protein
MKCVCCDNQISDESWTETVVYDGKEITVSFAALPVERDGFLCKQCEAQCAALAFDKKRTRAEAGGE